MQDPKLKDYKIIVGSHGFVGLIVCLRRQGAGIESPRSIKIVIFFFREKFFQNNEKKLNLLFQNKNDFVTVLKDIFKMDNSV